MSESAEITSVVDAFDKDDPFDLNLTLGFHQTWKHASLRRETSLNQPGLSSGGYVSGNENVASFNQSTSTLDLGADIGIYRDLALIIKMPIVLSDSQSLGDLAGSSSNPQRLSAPTGGPPLFSVPFKSPNRSGVDWLSAGLDWAIMNQQRVATKPTWVIGIEGRISVGAPLHACNVNPAPGSPQCPDHTDPGATSKSRNPGISRGMDTVAAHTIFSRRVGYVEPYSGLWFLADFPQANTDYGATDSFQGSLVNHPPIVGMFSMGMEVIPWEHREHFQRFVADFRLSGTYHSAGRDYSELFDALGSSQAKTLTTPNPGSYQNGLADNTSKAYFSGITDQDAFTSLGGKVSLTWQAGEYIKFIAGAGVTYNESHLITAADACNPSFTSESGTAGPCKVQGTVSGIPNPNFRQVIDLPGHRFSADDGTLVDLWISGVVMF